MKQFSQPKWILIFNTLPIVLLSLFMYKEYSIFHTLLNECQNEKWAIFAFSFWAIGLSIFAYYLYCKFQKKEIQVGFSIYLFIVYSIYIVLFLFNFYILVPSQSIPQWMYDQNLPLYAFTFVLPSFVHSLLILVHKTTQKIRKNELLKNTLALLIIPTSVYLFFQIIIPLISNFNAKWLRNSLIILFITVTFTFLFLLVRLIYLLTFNKKWGKYSIILRVLFAIILPLLGLAINNGAINIAPFENGETLFGDFRSPWFYGLATLNGILLCLPIFKNKWIMGLIYGLKCVLFSFSIYFLLVFLPFFPFSLIGIIAFGLGFLMLTPIVVFVLDLLQIEKIHTYLKSFIKPLYLNSIRFCLFFTLPIVLIITFKIDKFNLQKALNYVYFTDYQNDTNIDAEALQKTLNVIKYQKKNTFFLFNQNQPYITSFYKWIVLDNLTLSDSKISHLENIFMATPLRKRSINPVTKDQVKITNTHVKSIYDTKGKYWISTLDLEITNFDRQNSEYESSFTLPNGCYISNYYLYINGKKENGMLTEKKSAVWIYNSIRNENKDPGILFYKDFNTIGFHIFPFLKDEIRKTGIELIHKEPLKISIDEHLFVLGKDSWTVDNKSGTNWITAAKKKELKKLYRKPYFHFFIDASKNQKDSFHKRIDQIKQLTKEYPLDKEPKITWVNSTSGTLNLIEKNDFKTNLISFQGGFFLDRAFKKMFFENQINLDTEYYPILVVLTDQMENAIIETNFKGYLSHYFERETFYTFNDKQEATLHSLVSNPKEKIKQIEKIDTITKVACFSYLQNDENFLIDTLNQMSFLPLKERATIDSHASLWEKANNNHLNAIYQQFYPNAPYNLSLVKESFKSGVMSPLTSYIAVENEAQKAALLAKQEKVLSGHPALDIENDPTPMSEPSIAYFFVLTILFSKKIRSLLNKSIANAE